MSHLHHQLRAITTPKNPLSRRDRNISVFCYFAVIFKINGSLNNNIRQIIDFWKEKEGIRKRMKEDRRDKRKKKKEKRKKKEDTKIEERRKKAEKNEGGKRWNGGKGQRKEDGEK